VHSIIASEKILKQVKQHLFGATAAIEERYLNLGKCFVAT